MNFSTRISISRVDSLTGTVVGPNVLYRNYVSVNSKIDWCISGEEDTNQLPNNEFKIGVRLRVKIFLKLLIQASNFQARYEKRFD
jgi:hypothetical protein